MYYLNNLHFNVLLNTEKYNRIIGMRGGGKLSKTQIIIK